jgi:hypothetical protein
VQRIHTPWDVQDGDDEIAFLLTSFLFNFSVQLTHTPWDGKDEMSEARWTDYCVCV